ncbi:MAG: hypothetical protein JWL81_2760 [Verrucomicrobiales bacterium]|nr:hypothetical protein [Verrucomicrobiales bacterium]
MFTARDPITSRTRRCRGLTLLEVVVGLAILGLMAGAIYGIVSGSVEATADLATTQREDRRMETFLQRTRQALAHLPAGGTLELKVLENDPLRQEFTLRGVPEAYIHGVNPRWDKPVVTLAPRPWDEDRKKARAGSRPPTLTIPGNGSAMEGLPENRYSLAMTVPDFYRTTDEGESVPESPLQSRQGNQYVRPDDLGRFWVDLLPEVARVEWRFYDPAKKLWVEQQAASRPPMVELLLFLPGRTTPVRSVFSIL